MRPQFLIAGALFACPNAAAALDTYDCRSLSETDFPVTASFDLDYADDVFSIPRAELQIEGDIGYSSTAEHPSNRAFAADIEVGGDAVRFNFHLNDGEYDVDVARLHVVTLSEGAHSLTAGVLQVGGGGLWPIECDVTYEQQDGW
jgi:hypothetical protein